MVASALLALLAAFLFALASVLQQKAASSVPDSVGLKAGLVTRLVRQPLWLLGLTAAGVGFAVQAVALALGSLIVVQPLLVTMLLFALPLGAKLSGRRLATSDWRWAIALVAGLAIVLLVGDPTDGLDRAQGSHWIVALAVVYPLVIVLVGAASRRRGASRALLLGASAGILYGTTDALTKTVVRSLDDGLVAVLGNWEIWVLIVTICGAAFFQQSAYQSGGIAASVPAVTGLEPITGILLGILIYEERFQAEGVLEWGLMALGATLAVLGALALARSAGRDEAAHAPAT